MAALQLSLRSEQVKPDELLVIHHRQSRNVTMMIPSRVMIERPQGKGMPNLVERRHHHVWLDNDGNGEICGAVWQDICASGYGHHFLLMPNLNRPKKQVVGEHRTERTEVLTNHG